MRSILGDTLDVPPDAIDLTYPTGGSNGPQDQPPVPR
jgi:hypothetical protein